MALFTYFEGITKNMEELSENQLFEHFNKLLQVSIFYTGSILFKLNRLLVVTNPQKIIT